MSKKSYAEKLKDPRWQKRRLEIMQRDNWTCVACGDKDSTLNVHHKYYDDDAEGPWDYSDYALVTLCEKCHGIHHDLPDDPVDSMSFVIGCALNGLAHKILDGHLHVRIAEHLADRTEFLSKERSETEVRDWMEKKLVLIREIESAFTKGIADYSRLTDRQNVLGFLKSIGHV